MTAIAWAILFFCTVYSEVNDDRVKDTTPDGYFTLYTICFTASVAITTSDLLHTWVRHDR